MVFCSCDFRAFMSINKFCSDNFKLDTFSVSKYLRFRSIVVPSSVPTRWIIHKYFSRAPILNGRLAQFVKKYHDFCFASVVASFLGNFHRYANATNCLEFRKPFDCLEVWLLSEKLTRGNGSGLFDVCPGRLRILSDPGT